MPVTGLSYDYVVFDVPVGVSMIEFDGNVDDEGKSDFIGNG